MKRIYDLSKMRNRKAPFTSRLKKQVSLQMDPEVIAYFKSMSSTHNIPYQNLMQMYLKDCVINERKLEMSWASQAEERQQR